MFSRWEGGKRCRREGGRIRPNEAVRRRWEAFGARLSFGRVGLGEEFRRAREKGRGWKGGEGCIDLLRGRE